jgi:hypothetical protein
MERRIYLWQKLQKKLQKRKQLRHLKRSNKLNKCDIRLASRPENTAKLKENYD